LCYNLLEKPVAGAVRLWDRIFKWNHPKHAAFSKRELEDHLRQVGVEKDRRQ